MLYANRTHLKTYVRTSAGSRADHARHDRLLAIVRRLTHTALRAVDVQRHVVSRFPDPDYLPRLTKAIDAARAAGRPVIYVVVRFRPGAPEVSRRNRVFGALASAGLPGGEDAMQIHPDVTPAADDI